MKALHPIGFVLCRIIDSVKQTTPGHDAFSLAAGPWNIKDPFLFSRSRSVSWFTRKTFVSHSRERETEKSCLPFFRRMGLFIRWKKKNDTRKKKRGFLMRNPLDAQCHTHFSSIRREKGVHESYSIIDILQRMTESICVDYGLLPRSRWGKMAEADSTGKTIHGESREEERKRSICVYKRNWRWKGRAIGSRNLFISFWFFFFLLFLAWSLQMENRESIGWWW